MSTVTRRRRKMRSEGGSVQILEEAFHLVRTAELKWFLVYYAGVVPFAIALLYFVADMSRSSLADRDAAFSSLVMVGFYFWMRYCQAKYCAGLWDTISPGQLPVRSRWENFRYLAALWFLQAMYIPLLVFGLVVMIPLGWVIATIQNFSVLALTRDYGRKPLRRLAGESVKHSHVDWAQNHGVLLILGVVAFFTWINVVATCVIVPTFGKAFTGTDNVFTISPAMAVSNSTFLMGTLLLAYMVISPVAKGVYVLRCFYAESRTTGADLLSRLASCRERREREKRRDKSTWQRAAAIAVLFAVFPGGTVRAAEPSVPPDEFRREIGETMEQKKYQWKLSRRVLEGDVETEKSWLSLRLAEIAESVEQGIRKFFEWVEEMLDKLNKNQPKSKGSPGDGVDFKGLSSVLSVVLIVIVVAVVLWLVFLLYRKYHESEAIEADDPDFSGPIDLESEDIVASQLPEDEWMRLAREQMAKGDRRLAVRALFLATLANLGENGLLRIARFKSNLDYRRELELRARGESLLRSAFDENTSLFERVWYGLHMLGDQKVEEFLQNHDRIAREASRLISSRKALVGGGEPGV